MTAEPTNIPHHPSKLRGGWTTRLIASRRFQKWAAHFPLTRRIVRKEGEALFDLLAGFCHSQVLMALVKLDLFGKLAAGPQTLRSLAHQSQIPEQRMEVLLRAGVSLGLLKQRRDRFLMTRTGAALIGVPGLQAMISHHDVLYRDLADPVAFFRGEVETELADFWPYVFGGDMDLDVAATYSDLMAQSQVLVAEDTLHSVSFKQTEQLLDVGGGTGAFLEAVGTAHPDCKMVLFDLPAVVPEARQRFAAAGMTDRVTVHPGSFRSDPLPKGADTISLVRVLYDHADDMVSDLLSKCFEALPPGGRLIISEPMSGGKTPERAGDAYFALYTMAMRTGKARSCEEITRLCRVAGFAQVQAPRAIRPFVTRCIVAQKN